MSKIQLAEDLLFDQFGEVIGKVGSTLIARGPQTMTELIQITSLTFPQVRDALLVLIQHNMCVYYDKNIFLQKLESGNKGNDDEDEMKTSTEKMRELEEKRERFKMRSKGNENPNTGPLQSNEEEESEAIKAEKQKLFDRQSKIIYYQIIIDNIIMRLKSAKFLYVIKKKFGQTGEDILHILLQYGRLNLQELVSKVLQYMSERTHEMLILLETTQKNNIENTFQKMVKERFIKRVQPTVNSIQIQEEKKKKEGNNSTNDLREKLTKKNVATKRKTIIDDDNDDNTNSDGKAKKRKKKKTAQEEMMELDIEEDFSSYLTNAMSSGSSSLMNNEEQDMSSFNAENILWTTNYTQFIRTFRNQSILEYVERVIGEQFKSVVEVLFDETSSYQRGKNDPLSTPVKIEKIYERIQQHEDMGRKILENHLNYLSSNDIDVLKQMGRDTYVINLQGVVDKLKREDAEIIIGQKFSVIGCRIFRLLLEKKYMEQKHVAELALLPSGEARTLLFNMLRGGILTLQEVPKNKEHAPQQTFYLWGVRLDTVFDKLVEDMYKTVRNLRLRLKKEQQQIIESGILESTFLSEEQEEQIRRLKNIEDRLEASLIQLVDLLMLFEDF